MRNSWLAFGMIAAILLSACKKRDCCSFPSTPDFMLAQKNEAKWEGIPSAEILTGDTIVVSGQSNTDGKNEVVSFKLVFDGIGYYTLKANEINYSLTRTGVPIATYKSDPGHVNSVTIAAYNQADKILQGFFDLRFQKIKDVTDASSPDKIFMADGKFKVNIKH